MEKRLGVIAIVVEGGKEVAMSVQNILSDNSDVIIARMGIPDKDSNVSVISIIVKGTVEKLSALSGKLGKINNVTVKSALTTKEVF